MEDIETITIPLSAFAYILSMDPEVSSRGDDESLDLSIAIADDVLEAAVDALRATGRGEKALLIEKVMESFT